MKKPHRLPLAVYNFRRKVMPVILYIVIVFAISISVNYLISGLFGLRQIIVAGSNIKLTINHDKMPRNIIFIPTEKLRNEIISDNPGISEVNINRIFPNSLKITISTRPPAVRLMTKSRMVIVSQDGTILGSPENEYISSDLPLLSFFWDDIGDGNRFTSDLIRVVISYLEKINQQIKIYNVEMLDSDTIVFLGKGASILVPVSGKSPEIVASTLQTILLRVRMNENAPVRIDLRYDKPVVSNEKYGP